MNVGETRATLKLNDEISAQLEAFIRRMEAVALTVERGQSGSISGALLGAAAAAVLLPKPSKPVSRRRLLFPWSWQ